MTLAMEWSGQHAFASKPLREWKAGHEVAGLTRSEGLLTFATIYGAGHFVRVACCVDGFKLITHVIQAPHDKPVEALGLVTRWLAQEDL